MNGTKQFSKLNLFVYKTLTLLMMVFGICKLSNAQVHDLLLDEANVSSENTLEPGTLSVREAKQNGAKPNKVVVPELIELDELLELPERNEVRLKSVASYVPVYEGDSLALIAFYEATNGSSWYRNDNWLTGTLRDWYGVTVEDGRVTELYLAYNNISGYLPDEIGNLTALRRLTIWGNTAMSGAIPNTIGNLSKLEVLQLANGHTGELPAGIWQLDSLSDLLLDSNDELTGNIPAEVGNLQNLVRLNITSSKLNGIIPSEIGQLSNLVYLGLDNNELSGYLPAELGQLTQCRSVYLYNNQLSGNIPPEMGNMDSLVIFNANSNLLTGNIPEELGSLQKFEYLNVTNNLLSGQLPATFAFMDSLRVLYLGYNKFTFSDIANSGLQPFNLEAFEYAPQDTLFPLTFNSNTQTLEVNDGKAADNLYQWHWYKTPMAGEASDQLIGIDTSGAYYCFVTNPNYPKLELKSEPFGNIVTDIDGNVYTTVKIGEQEWLAENLKVKRYQDRTFISNGTGFMNIYADEDFFFAYNDSIELADEYGLLYSDYTVLEQCDVCPSGWKVPSNDQWKVMEMQLGMTWDIANVWGWIAGHGDNEGGKLKETGYEHWDLPNVGATNESGFTALPAGYRELTFSGLGEDAYFMTSTPIGNSVKLRIYNYNHGKTYQGSASQGIAGSIRCIRIQEGQTVPQVSTDNILSVAASTATIEGSVVGDGNATVVARGIVYGNDPNPVVDIQQGYYFTSQGAGVGQFTDTLMDLFPGYTYYARAYAVNANGISYGETVSFTTSMDDLPSVSYPQIENILETSFVANSTIEYEGQSSVISRGFVWGRSNYPTLADSFIELGNGSGEFSGEIKDLNPDTQYYLRAYATNDQGTVYSTQRNIRTLTDKPSPLVQTVEVENVYLREANVVAQVVDDAGYSIWDRGIKVSRDDGSFEMSAGTGLGEYQVFLTDLLPNTVYRVSAYAVNENGKSYGNEISFRTYIETVEQAGNLLEDIYKELYVRNTDLGTGHDNFGQASFNLTSDLMGEDMVVHSRGYGWFIDHYQYIDPANKESNLVKYTWSRYYNIIDEVNSALDQLYLVEGDEDLKDNLIGQMLALRAFCHFQLVQVFADTYALGAQSEGIPIVWEGQSVPGPSSGILNKNTLEEVYALINSDLDAAIVMLGYSNQQNTPANIDTEVAYGLKARVALVTGKFAEAEVFADQAIRMHGGYLFSTFDYPGEFWNPDYYQPMSGFNDAYHSSEWMWGSVIADEDNTGYGSFWSHMDPRFLSYASLGGQKKITQELYDLIPYSDSRKNLWVAPNTSYYYGNANIPPLCQVKFLSQQLGAMYGDYVYMRLAEMFLIKAEAQAQQGKTGEAASSLNELVISRDPGYYFPPGSQQDMLNEIWLQRRIELWGEGHRLLDIKRLQSPLNRPAGENNHDPTLAIVTALPENDEMFNFQIPYFNPLSVSQQGKGTVFLDNQQYTYPVLMATQTAFTLEAVPDTGWVFVSWTNEIGEEISTDASFNYTMPSDTSGLTANFMEIDCPQHFHPIWEGSQGTEHMNIYVVDAKVDGADLDPGDQIGIFDNERCVGQGLVIQKIDQENLLSIVVSADDGTGNGFNTGNPISYKIYKCSSGEEITNVSTQCYTNQLVSVDCPGFMSGATSFVALNGIANANYTLELQEGWNIFSSPVLPDSSNMEFLFSDLIYENVLVKIQDEAGSSLEDYGIFGGWQNEIGDIQLTEGYKIKVNEYDSLNLRGGISVYPFPISLNPGWNIIGYPQLSTANAKEVVQPLIDSGTLLKVQNEKGSAIENLGIYGGWQNFIGNFEPGEGYKVKVSSPDTLWIYESYLKSLSVFSTPIPTQHFKTGFAGNGVDHMNFNLVELSEDLLNIGDELSVYDGANCVGAIVVTADHLKYKRVSVPASATDDNGTPGFTVGNQYSLRVWNVAEKREEKLEPEYVFGAKQFTKHESVLLSLKNAQITSVNESLLNTENTVKCYPNPFSEVINIEIGLELESSVTVSVQNQLGQEVRKLVNNAKMNKGISRLIWDGKNTDRSRVSAGIYLITIQVDGQLRIEKIVRF